MTQKNSMTGSSLKLSPVPPLLGISGLALVLLIITLLPGMRPYLPTDQRPGLPVDQVDVADANKEFEADPPPVTLRAIYVAEDEEAKLLTVHIRKVIPYDKLLMHADGCVVQDRDTGEEFTIIFERDLPAPVE